MAGVHRLWFTDRLNLGKSKLVWHGELVRPNTRIRRHCLPNSTSKIEKAVRKYEMTGAIIITFVGIWSGTALTCRSSVSGQLRMQGS